MTEQEGEKIVLRKALPHNFLSKSDLTFTIFITNRIILYVE